MNRRLLLPIGVAAAMLGGALGLVATGTGAVAVESDDAARYADRAAAALAKRNGAVAVRFAEQAVALAPQDAVRRALLGRAYLAAGRFASAVQAFSDVLAIDPADGRSALNLALAQTATGDWVGARGTLTAHAERIGAADRGLALALAGDPAGGIALLAQAARDPAATATVRQNLALALALDGRWVEARSVASIDMSGDQVDRRLGEWAQFARPANAAQQVATLLGVTPVADRGQPVQLALAPPPAVPARAAVAAVAPLAAPAAVATPVAVAATDTPQPAIRFAPRQEIVQALPAQYAQAAPVRTAARAAPPEPRTPATSSYYVQLGAYANVAVARDAWTRLSRRSPALGRMQPQGIHASIGGNRFYRLSVGGLARADAAGLCRDLRAQRARCFVRARAGEQLAQWARPAQYARR
ncbi:SPOR domain-containing protein [Sphingomonas sp. VNH70]|uniref:SPOR domain-containing protein n=1 Tax=Sphingomonas silueang TaxID=3156617 RepID=UPI0032B3DA86